MARIMMKKAHNESISEVFEGFMLSAQSRGLTNKTLASYKTHFHSISKRLDIEMPISQLTKRDLEEMIAKMREEGFVGRLNHIKMRLELRFKPFFLFFTKMGQTSTKSVSDAALKNIINCSSIYSGGCLKFSFTQNSIYGEMIAVNTEA